MVCRLSLNLESKILIDTNAVIYAIIDEKLKKNISNFLKDKNITIIICK